MSLVDLVLIMAVMLGLSVMRFGIPLLLMWGLGRLLSVFTHPAL